MRAALVHELGDPPVLEDVPEPERGPGEALVEVLAAPLNPVDLRIAAGGFYAGDPEPPYVPGTEAMGRVVEGDRLAAGARVFLEPSGGVGGPGALCERVAIAEERCLEAPAGGDDAVLASLGVAGIAGWAALSDVAEMQPGERVLVLGATGVVGLIAVQAARLLGAGRIIAAGRDPDGLRRALELGADATVGLHPQTTAADLTQAAGGPIDVIVDPLWGRPAELALEAGGFRARLAQLGQSAGATAAFPSATIRSRGQRILGHTNFQLPPERRHELWRTMAEHVIAGDLVLEVEQLPLDSAPDAWRRQARSPGRKLVLVP